MTTYTVDPLDRNTGTLYPNGSRVTTTFDAQSQQTTVQDGTGITSYSYGAEGELGSVTAPTGKILTYNYNALLLRTALLDQDGGRTTYVNDSRRMVVGITNPLNEKTTITYDAVLREQTRVHANGMTVSHLYDSVSNAIGQQIWSPTGTPIALYTATYDRVGNRMTMVEIDGTRSTFSYDPTYQLTNEQRSGTNAYNTTYQYDPVGNRTLKNDSGQRTTYSYSAGNQMTLVTPPAGQPTTISWDLRGNCTVENTGGALTTYTWDYENRMTSVSS